MLDLKSFQEAGQRALEFLKKDLQTIRTNRASTDLVAHILVDAYGVKTPLEQLANITIPEPRSIVIQPWDKNVIKEIETALTRANLGITPMVKEAVVHLNLPPLNEETRKDLVKILHQKQEKAKVNLRNIRDEERSKINKAAKDKTVSEDDKYDLLEELDKKTSGLMTEIEKIGEKKEKEIITI